MAILLLHRKSRFLLFIIIIFLCDNEEAAK
jgi:hypothetical protein